VTCLSATNPPVETAAPPPCTAQLGDQVDVMITTQVSDVRCVGVSGGCSVAGGNYSGKLLFNVTPRITDRLNGLSLAESATASDTPFNLGLGCSAGACNLTTSADAVMPNLVREQKRAIWQLSQIQVLDGGPDGDLAAAPTPASGVCPPACQGNGGETVFLRQGFFAP
jgi:hypothetical protein